MRSDQGSADLKVIVTGTNNRDYAVKEVSDGQGFVPASELFCYEIARLVDIPTPSYDFIRMPDGSIAFGSAWEGGVHKISDTNQIAQILNGKLLVRDIEAFFSRVYALDLFVNNIDRHFGNYLFRASYNSMIGLAFDYSRAWYEVDAFGSQSFRDKTCNTQVCHSAIKQFSKYDKKEALSTLDRLSNLSPENIGSVFNMIPASWFPDSYREELTAAWREGRIQERLNYLMTVV